MRERFWIKLMDDFINSRKIKILEKQGAGHSLVLLLIHLMSDVKNSNGVLIDDLGFDKQPMTADTIHEEHPSFDAGFIDGALQKYLDMGFLRRRDDGYLEFIDYEKLINTKDAAKQQRYRDRLKNEDGNEDDNEVGNNVTGNVTHSQSQSQSQREKESLNHMSSSSNAEPETDDGKRDDDDGFEIVLKGFGDSLNGMSPDLINHAKQVARENSTSNPTGYFKRTLYDYLGRGFKTATDAIEADARRVTVGKTTGNPALNYQQRNNDGYENFHYANLDE